MEPSRVFLNVSVFALLLIVLCATVVSNFGQANVSMLNGTFNTDANYSTPPSLLQFEWPQLQGDNSFTRFSSGPAPEAPDILWKTNITGIQSYISAFNGKIYATTKTSVYALDGGTGKVVWNTNIHAPGSWPAVFKIDGAHMIVGSSCLDPQTGRILWTSPDFSASSQPLFTYNVYSPDEKIFYVKANSYVQAWNFSNPSVLPKMEWQTYVSGGGLTGSGIQYGEGRIFPGSFASHQIALDAKTGKVLWDTETTGPMLFSGTFSDGKFFRGGTHDNKFYSFDANTGKILWTFNPDSADGYWCSGTAAAYGMVYGLNKDGYLYALDENTGNVVWKYKGPGLLMFPGTPTVADGKIYATTGQEASYGELNGTSEFACLDAYTGQVVWKLPIEAFAPRESVAVAYGNLYMIPGDVTEAVDSISGSEYNTVNQIWAMGTTSWSMYRHDSAHTAEGQSGPTTLTLRWQFTTGGSVVSSPSVSNGVAYFGSQDKNIYAVSAHDGSLIWKFATQDRIESSPAVVNGRVYSGTDDGNLYCLDVYNGSLLWTAYAGGLVQANFAASVHLSSSPTVVDGHVYVGALDNTTYCINAETGNVSWTFQTNGYITSSPAVVEGAVYVTSQEPSSGVLYKIDADNGSLVWKQTLPYQPTFMGGKDMHASPTVAAGLVFTSSSTSIYYGINATTGNVVWTYKNPAAEEFILCSPIFTAGKVFLIDKFSIVCVDARNGSALWSSFLGDELYISPSYADGKLYVVTDQRHLYVLDAQNGQKIGVYGFSSNGWSSPTIYEGRVFVGNNDWNVYCLAEYPSLVGSLTLTLDKSEVSTGDLVTGYGQLAPGMNNAALVITLVKPDGSSDNLETVTSSKGSYSFTFNPQKEGNWTATAMWWSDKSYYKSAISEAASLAVYGSATPTPSPTESPSPSSSETPMPTPTPFDQLKFAGVPLLYLYIGVIVALLAVVVATGYLYVKSNKN